MGLRILHSIHSVNPAIGGPIEGLKQMSLVNQQYGHAVEVVCLDDPAAPWVKECPFTCHAVGPAFFKYGYSSKLVPWLQANRRNYDVVVVNGIWQYNAFGVWRALQNTTTPYFVFTHGMLDPWFKEAYPLKHLKKWFYWPWGDYRTLRDATAVFFTCEEERRLARKSFWLYKADEFVVNYGTRGPIGDTAKQKQAFAEKFPVVNGKKVLLFLGRVHVKKGNDLLFKAFAELVKNSTDPELQKYHIIVAGPNDHPYGHEMAALVKQLGIEDRVTWTGMLQGDLKWGAFYNADAFILPSHQENFGIAVAEALACSVPVLISNKVNIWREILMHQAGLVETDDVEGTKLLLKHWIETPEEQKALMRKNAIDCFSRRFHINKTAESFIEALHAFGLRWKGDGGAPEDASAIQDSR